MNENIDKQAKKGLKLLAKILLVAMTPMVILVIVAGIAIKGVGTVVSSKIIEHELNATAYAMELYMNSLSADEYTYKDGSLYKGDVNITDRQNILDEFRDNSSVEVSMFWGDERVATSVQYEDGSRPLSEKMSDKVKNAVEKDGYYFTDNVRIADNDYYGYYEQIDGTDCIIFTGIESSIAKGEYVPRTRKAIMSMSFIALLGCAFICLVIVILVKAIKAIVGNLDNVANGELTLKVSDKLLNRSDEIGNIARSIHSLIMNMAGVVNNIHKSSGELNEFSDTFHQKFASINGSISNVNIAIDEIANGATSQAGEMQDVSDKMNTIGDAIASVQNEIVNLDDSAKQMRSHNEKAGDTLVNLVEISERTKNAVDDVFEQTNVTNSSAMDIREAMELITEIANQTNLLSLNASIEAARAGEHGRGFAVVADEIRQLADQSRESAVKINEIVEALINNSNTSVETMNNVLQEINNQNEKLSITKSAFDRLGKEINNVSNSIDNITGMVNDINNAKNDVIGSIEGLAAIAQENAASTQETSASMVELSQIVNDCSEATDRLVDISGEMDENVNKFKL